MGFRGGGGQIDPPQHILVFKYPSRDRVKLENFKLQEKSKFLNVVLIQGNPEKIRLYARKLTEHDNLKVQLYTIFKRSTKLFEKKKTSLLLQEIKDERKNTG